MVSSAMFDWNDEELANILWGEAGVSDDHIVPYPDGNENKYPGSYGDNKKRWEKEVDCVKPAEQKKHVAATDYHTPKNGCNSQYDTYGGVPATRLGSWPDLSLSNSAKADQNSVEQSSQITEMSNYESSRDVEKPHLDEGSELCNQPEEREESDFANYSWANIGSFDDLDRIFSKDDHFFGHGNVEEPCLSSEEVTRSPEIAVSVSVDSPNLGLEALGSKSEQFETNVIHRLDQDQAKHGYQKMNDYSWHSPQGVKGSRVNMEYVGCNIQPTLGDKEESEMVGPTSSFNSGTGAIPIDSADKVSGQRKLIKNKKLGVTSETRKLHKFGGSWISYGPQLEQYDTQYVPLMGQPSPSRVCSQQQFHGHESFQYKHFTNVLLTPEQAFEVQYPSVPATPHFQSGEVKHQQVPTAYDISSCNRNTSYEGLNAPRKILNMTPKEKIEKLRRRQQMRAILAIQKQHQKFSHQASWKGNCISPRCSHENHMQLMEGGSMEVDVSPTLLPSHDPSSPMDLNNSNFVHLNNDDCSIEDSILHQLQDAITKLDSQTTLCIRDSLFRLAQSSIHRQHASDTISVNKSSRDKLDVLVEGANGHNRFSKMSDVETETNSIDRTVAHLLFHRPLALSGKLPLLESPLPTNLGNERKATAVMRLPKGVFTEGYKDDPSIDIPCLLTEGNESKSPCPNTSENASNNETADGEAMEVETSQ